MALGFWLESGCPCVIVRGFKLRCHEACGLVDISVGQIGRKDSQSSRAEAWNMKTASVHVPDTGRMLQERRPGALGLPASWSCYACAAVCVRVHVSMPRCQEVCSMSLSDLLVLEAVYISEPPVVPSTGPDTPWGGLPTPCAETSLPKGL